MKITSAQATQLQKHFRGIFRFRETYEEVYDHLLTAVDNAPADAVFEDVINTVIKHDFGGYNTLKKLEVTKQHNINRAVNASAWQYFIKNCPAGMLILAAVYGLVMYNLLQSAQAAKVLLVLLVLILVFPYVLINIWRYQSAYNLKDAKRSIMDEALVKVATVPYMLTCISFFIFNYVWHQSPFDGLDHLPTFQLSIVFIVITMYCLSFYKWYKSGFKLNVL